MTDDDIEVPVAFARLTVAREGRAGEEWIAALPGIVADVLCRWGLRVDGPVTHGQVGVVVPVTGAAGRSVVKVSFPHEGNRSEGWALRVFDGRATVRVHAEDTDRFALHLERARAAPSTAVLDLAGWLEVAAGIAVDLAVTAPADAPTLCAAAPAWRETIDRQVAALPGMPAPRSVQRTRAAIDALGADRSPTLVHGDLHEGNVLAADRRPWLAVDPKGYRGPLAWDAFTVCTTRVDQPDFLARPAAELRSRVRWFAGLVGEDVETAVELAHARAVSSLLHETLGGGAIFGRRLLERVVAEM